MLVRCYSVLMMKSNLSKAKTLSSEISKTGATTTLRNQAYERFTELVLASQLKPGQFVSQQELTLLLGMSLGAVREMIPRLEAARLIVAVPKRGLQITQADLKLIRNAFHVRTVVEREAVTCFIKLVGDDELNQITRQHEEILERARKAGEDPLLDSDAQAIDWGLHNRMVDSMDNEILSDVYRVNTLHIKLIRIDSELAKPMRVVPAMLEHLEFIKALQARDTSLATELITNHIAASRQRVLARAMGGSEINTAITLRTA